MVETSNASLQEDDKRNRRRRALLALVLLLVLITTSMVGYVLGRSASGPLGQVTDTILLSPQVPAGRMSAHLTGKVVYGDGSPAAGLKLELHSDPIVAHADDAGTFLFPNAPFGSHRIIVYGPDGSKAAERALTISQDEAEEGVSISKSDDGSSVITLAVNVRMLEVVIQLDDHGSLDILATGLTYADGSGAVVTPTGTASIDRGVIVTPNGSVLLPDGTIVIPRNGQNTAAVILPNDQVIYLDQDREGEGYTIKTDGTVELPNGASVRPGGQVVTSDGAQRGPGEGGVVVSGGNVVTPIGGTGSTGGGASTGGAPSGGGTSSGGGASAGGSTPSGSGTPSGGTSSGGNASGGGNQPSGNTPGGNPPSGTDTPGTDTPGGDTPVRPDPDPDPDTPGGDDPADGSLAVHGQNRDGSFAPWTQSSTIDLFYNRTSGAQEKIAPGSSGYYLFRLQNTLSSPLNVTISFNEADLHLPLDLTLTPVDASGRPVGQQVAAGSLSADGGLALQASVAGKSDVAYRLDWTWPAEGNDRLDTLIGSGSNLAYLLTMTIHAEQA